MSDSGILPPPYDPTDPNGRYSIDNIAVLRSIEDTDKFCRMHSHDNNYAGLKLGQRIQINDGTYNKSWIIAGFDCEYNHTASDGTIKNNGYGIALIPETQLTTAHWDADYTSNTPYIESSMHITTLPTIANNLKNVLGTHLVNRNVLLSSSVSTSTDVGSTAYTWTTAYCTLMSIGQMTGTFAKNNNKYDDGEANYKLPLFNYMNYWTGSRFWSRGVFGNDGRGYYTSWIVDDVGAISGENILGTTRGVRPLIYIR